MKQRYEVTTDKFLRRFQPKPIPMKITQSNILFTKHRKKRTKTITSTTCFLCRLKTRTFIKLYQTFSMYVFFSPIKKQEGETKPNYHKRARTLFCARCYLILETWQLKKSLKKAQFFYIKKMLLFCYADMNPLLTNISDTQVTVKARGSLVHLFFLYSFFHSLMKMNN